MNNDLDLGSTFGRPKPKLSRRDLESSTPDYEMIRNLDAENTEEEIFPQMTSPT